MDALRGGIGRHLLYDRSFRRHHDHQESAYLELQTTFRYLFVLKFFKSRGLERHNDHRNLPLLMLPTTFL